MEQEEIGPVPAPAPASDVDSGVPHPSDTTNDSSSLTRQFQEISIPSYISQRPGYVQKICKHYVRWGKCLYGDRCVFLHVEPPRASLIQSASDSDSPVTDSNSTSNDETLKDKQAPVIKYMQTKEKPPPYSNRKPAVRDPRQSGYSYRNPRIEMRRKPCGRLRIYNGSKCSEIRYFLLRNFTRDYLRSGSGIVDVAGGKGEFAFEALNLNYFPTTIFDPRPTNMPFFFKKWGKTSYHRVSPWKLKYNDCLDLDGSRPPAAPKHVRVMFGPSLYDETMDYEERKAIFERSARAALNSEWTIKGLVFHDSMTKEEYQQALVERPNEVQSFEECVDILKNCSVLVGVHPDQAAEAIVDCALAYKKPFVLLPCCTYHREFPKRKLPDGRLVKKFEELCDYLQGKDPRIRRMMMNFEGKNILLFADFSKSEPMEPVPETIFDDINFPKLRLVGEGNGEDSSQIDEMESVCDSHMDGNESEYEQEDGQEDGKEDEHEIEVSDDT